MESPVQNPLPTLIFFYDNLFLQFTMSYVFFSFSFFMNHYRCNSYNRYKALFKKRQTISTFTQQYTKSAVCGLKVKKSQFSAAKIFNDMFSGSQVFSKVISSTWNSYKLNIESFEEAFIYKP